MIRRGGEGVRLGGVCAAEEEADQTEVVREKLGFSGGFLQLDLSDFSPGAARRGPGRDSVSPGAAPPGLAPTPPPGPGRPEQLGLLGKRAAAGRLPKPGFSPRGSLPEKPSAGSERTGMGSF